MPSTSADLVREPWLLDSDRVYSLEGYEARIIGETYGRYVIEFYDDSDSVVEANIDKSEFADYPEEPAIGMFFGLVFYKLEEQSELRLAVWPVTSYWNKSLVAKFSSNCRGKQDEQH